MSLAPAHPDSDQNRGGIEAVTYWSPGRRGAPASAR